MYFQANDALLVFDTDELWFLSFSEDFFNFDPELVTFLDKSPQVRKKKLLDPGLKITKVYHAQYLSDFLAAFIKALDTEADTVNTYLIQYADVNEENSKLVKLKVPPAVAINGEEGEITAARFW